jgi:hypothetical protein
MGTMVRTPDNIEIILDLIRRAKMVDQDAVAWMSNLPEDWQYTTVAWEDNVPNGDYQKADVFPGRVDKYNDLTMFRSWNMVRSARLVLASLIVRCAAWVCSPVDYRTTPEYATAARTCAETITDVIASIPYQLGWRPKGRKYTAQEPEPMSAETSNSIMLAGFMLTWPLMILIGQDYMTDAQRAWVDGRLRYIGNEVGIKYALILRQVRRKDLSFLTRKCC